MLLDYEYNRLNNAQILAKNRELIRVFNELESELSKVINQAKIKYPTDFPTRNIYARNTSLKNKIERVLKEYNTKALASISDGIKAQWTLGNDKNDAIIQQVSKYTTLTDPKVIEMMQGLNLAALDQFITRKTAGMNLSQRIWDIQVAQNRELLELYLGSGITRGRSAQKVSQDIRQLLNEPDKLFRRVRDKDGKLVLSAAAEAYHPGRGVYRSSAKNAKRLAATEINMAFHNADFLRRQELPFVKGILVKLSASHPQEDICDGLAGAYPKGFMFEGWHPACFCYTTTILADRADVVKYLKTGEISQADNVRSIPAGAKSYIKDNKVAFNRMLNKPYFLEKNFTKELTLRKSVTQ